MPPGSPFMLTISLILRVIPRSPLFWSCRAALKEISIRRLKIVDSVIRGQQIAGSFSHSGNELDEAGGRKIRS